MICLTARERRERRFKELVAYLTPERERLREILAEPEGFEDLRKTCKATYGPDLKSPTLRKALAVVMRPVVVDFGDGSRGAVKASNALFDGVEA